MFSIGKEQIESIKTNGLERKLLLKGGLDMPEDIVVDEVGRTFYFSDSQKGIFPFCKLGRTK